MSPRGKRRSEAQRRHDHLPHKACHDHGAYSAAWMRTQRERAHAAEMDMVQNKNMLASAQNQVCPLSTVNGVEIDLMTCQVLRLEQTLSLRASKVDELSQALDSKEGELWASTAQCSTLTEKNSSLHRDVDRLRKKCNRAEETHSRAIERAVDTARKHFESANTRRIKRPDGRIEDWVRDLVVELVALDGVPTAKVPSVIDWVRRCFVPEETGDGHDQDGDDERKQTISDRSVRRIMAESYVKAFLRAAHVFSKAPCQCQTYNPMNDELNFDNV